MLPLTQGLVNSISTIFTRHRSLTVMMHHSTAARPHDARLQVATGTRITSTWVRHNPHGEAVHGLVGKEKRCMAWWVRRSGAWLGG